MLHPEAEAILEALADELAEALRADARADLACVVLAGREGIELPGTTRSATGARWSIMPRREALALGQAHTLETGDVLGEALGAGEAWVLVLGPEGAAAAPLVWSSADGAPTS